jgi:hypothetical protein
MIPTLILGAAFAAAAALFGWLGARPARPNAEPRLAPWRFLMMLAFLGVLFAFVHAMTLLRGR